MKRSSRFEGGEANFGLVGDSPEIRHVLRIIRKLENDTSPVLIAGESGVGKELVARALWTVSPLAEKPFLAVDSATLVGSLMESELFGHVKGSFTGAVGNHMGLVRAADGGTLFLDEIGELTPAVQAKLLRLLQEQEIRPIGGAHTIKVSVRILAATNRDLRRAVEKGEFRRDLYFRLKVVAICVPPLRDRKEDISLLAAHFLAKHAPHSVRLSREVLDRFIEYDWPGNVRELENVIRSMVALRSDPYLEWCDLPSSLRPGSVPSTATGDELLPLREVERRHILRVLDHTKGDVAVAARFLGVSKATIYRKLKQYEAAERSPQRRRSMKASA